MFLYKLRRYKWYLLGRRSIVKTINRTASSQTPIKIIIGAGPTEYDGWISTDLPHFNILKEQDWSYFFGKHKIDNLLSEHVLEHLTESQVDTFLKLATSKLKPGGRIRIAVPDKNHPNPSYIEHVKPGGSGPGADDHKSFWSIDMYEQLAQKFNLQFAPIEYFDPEGNFTFSEFDNSQGIINRSGGRSKNENEYSSLIVDLIATN